MLDWLILGGGIHGTYLSHVLTHQGGVARDRVRVLDPHAVPLARWDTCTENVGMAYLRSSFVHHLGTEPYDLKKFVHDRGIKSKKAFLGRYLRPSQRVFRDHARHVIEQYALEALRIRGEAMALVARPQGIRVETGDGALDAKRVLLAIGMGEQPEYPTFARELQARQAPIHHVFDRDYSPQRMDAFRKIVVVGGGISAVQTALSLARQNRSEVTLLSRHALRIRSFDTDPGWMGPKNLSAFARISDPDERRRVIRSARYRGSVPDDVAAALRVAVAQGKVVHRLASIVSTKYEEGTIQLQLDDSNPSLAADAVVLATGFEARRPGGSWLTRAIQDLGLRCASCGYPIVNPDLRWHPNILVSGPLAELELGPPARNILGARMAAERLLAAV